MPLTEGYPEGTLIEDVRLEKADNGYLIKYYVRSPVKKDDDKLCHREGEYKQAIFTNEQRDEVLPAFDKLSAMNKKTY